MTELQTGRKKVDKKIKRMQQLQLNRLQNEFNRVSNDLKENYLSRDEFETYKELMTPYFDVRYQNIKDDWEIYDSFLKRMSEVKKPEPRTQGEKQLLDRINSDVEYLEGLRRQKNEEMDKLHKGVKDYNEWIDGLLDDIEKADETGEYNRNEFMKKIVGGMDGNTPFSVYEYDELTPEEKEESKQLMQKIKRMENETKLKERSDMEVRADIYQKMVLGQVEAYRDDIKNYIAEVSVEFENLRRKFRENDERRKKVDENIDKLFSNEKDMSDYLNKVASKLYDIDTQVSKWNSIFGKEGSVKKLGEMFPVFDEFYKQIMDDFKISSNRMDSERMTHFNQKIELLGRAINEVNNRQLQNDVLLKNLTENYDNRFLDLERRNKLYIDQVGNELAKQLGMSKDELKKNINDLSLSMGRMDERYVSYNKLNERLNDLVEEYKIPELYNAIENYKVLSDQEIKNLEKNIYFKMNNIELNINEKQKNIEELGKGLIGLHNDLKQVITNVDGMSVNVKENRGAIENLMKNIENVMYVVESNKKSYLADKNDMSQFIIQKVDELRNEVLHNVDNVNKDIIKQISNTLQNYEKQIGTEINKHISSYVDYVKKPIEDDIKDVKDKIQKYDIYIDGEVGRKARSKTFEYEMGMVKDNLTDQDRMRMENIQNKMRDYMLKKDSHGITEYQYDQMIADLWNTYPIEMRASEIMEEQKQLGEDMTYEVALELARGEEEQTEERRIQKKKEEYKQNALYKRFYGEAMGIHNERRKEKEARYRRRMREDEITRRMGNAMEFQRNLELMPPIMNNERLITRPTRVERENNRRDIGITRAVNRRRIEREVTEELNEVPTRVNTPVQNQPFETIINRERNTNYQYLHWTPYTVFRKENPTNLTSYEDFYKFYSRDLPRYRRAADEYNSRMNRNNRPQNIFNEIDRNDPDIQARIELTNNERYNERINRTNREHVNETAEWARNRLLGNRKDIDGTDLHPND